MMLQIMMYAVVVAAVFGAIGMCLEHLARLHGLSRRNAWMAAMLLSVLLPVVMIRFARPEPIEDLPAPVTEWRAPDIILAPADPVESQMPLPAPVPAAAKASVKREPAWKIPAPSDNQLIAAWLATSSVLCLYLCGAAFMLRRRAAGWQRATLLEQDVLVSEVTGPALIGVLRPRIVVPRWLLAQPVATQALILEHEQQHLQARDPLLMAAGLIVIAAVPWNLPLWWQWRRLRQAIELDCDARVLRTGAEANSYAEVLLAVTRRAARMPAGALAMSEPVNVLERRIENLVPDALRYVRAQTMALLALIAAGATAATAVEAPGLPARLVAGAVTSALQYTEAPGFPVPAAVVTAAAATTSAPSPTAAGDTAATAAQSQPALPPTAFTVRLLPLDATDPGVMDKAALDRIHAALAARLRVLPGLTLLAPESAGGQSPNYEIEMKPVVMRGVQWVNYRVLTLSKPSPSIFEVQRAASSPPRQVAGAAVTTAEGGDRGATFIGNTIANLRGLDPSFGTRTLTVVDGRRVVTASNQADVVDLDIIPLNLLERMDVVTGYGERLDLDRDMEDFVARLRVSTFPADPTLKANLLDTRVQFDVRQKALDLLLRTAPFTLSLDPEVLRGGVDLATTATDPLRRPAVWKQLGRTRSPEVIGPLVQALGAEKDDQVRLDLIGVLSRDFSTDPQARAALEAVARNDRQQIARMAAQRALTGIGGWNEFLVATLKNPQLTDSQRLAPLAYVESSGLFAQGWPALDDEAIRILANLIAKAPVYSPGVRAAAVALASSGSPAALEAIVDIVRPRDSRSAAGHAARDTVLYHVGGRVPMDPRIRAVFEEIAARDADPAVRGTSQVMLDMEARRMARDAGSGRGQ